MYGLNCTFSFAWGNKRKTLPYIRLTCPVYTSIKVAPLSYLGYFKPEILRSVIYSLLESINYINLTCLLFLVVFRSMDIYIQIYFGSFMFLFITFISSVPTKARTTWPVFIQQPWINGLEDFGTNFAKYAKFDFILWSVFFFSKCTLTWTFSSPKIDLYASTYEVCKINSGPIDTVYRKLCPSTGM